MQKFIEKIKNLDVLGARESILRNNLIEKASSLLLEDEPDVHEITVDEVMVYSAVYFPEELVALVLKTRELLRYYSLTMAINSKPERITLKEQLFDKAILTIQDLKVYPLKIILEIYNFARIEITDEKPVRFDKENLDKLVVELIRYEIENIHQQLLDSHSILIDTVKSFLVYPEYERYGYLEISDGTTSNFIINSKSLDCNYLEAAYKAHRGNNDIWKELLKSVERSDEIYIASNNEFVDIKKYLLASLHRIFNQY